MRGTSFRTFVLSPLLVVGWEWLWTDGRPRVEARFLPLMAWGYLQYRLVGVYRVRHGGGGPGMQTPPERLVTGGPYAWSRNPMYLGHLIFLMGLTLTFQSPLAGVLTTAALFWFHRRVQRDEARLRERFGQPYVEYCARIRRWIPGLI